MIGTRVEYTSEEIERLAALAGVHVVWQRARCQHGHTLDESCVQCENGYVDDMHPFISACNVSLDRESWSSYHGQGTPLAGVTCDGADACYIPSRFQKKVDKVIDLRDRWEEK